MVLLTLDMVLKWQMEGFITPTRLLSTFLRLIINSRNRAFIKRLMEFIVYTRIMEQNTIKEIYVSLLLQLRPHLHLTYQEDLGYMVLTCLSLILTILRMNQLNMLGLICHVVIHSLRTVVHGKYHLRQQKVVWMVLYVLQQQVIRHMELSICLFKTSNSLYH